MESSLWRKLISNEGEVSKRKLSFTIIPPCSNELPSWIFTKRGETAFACCYTRILSTFSPPPRCVHGFLNERTSRLIGRFVYLDYASVTWSHRTYILIGELIRCSAMIRGCLQLKQLLFILVGGSFVSKFCKVWQILLAPEII